MKRKGEISWTLCRTASHLLAALVGVSLLLPTGCCAINYVVSNVSGTLAPNDLTASTPILIEEFQLEEPLRKKDNEIGSRIKKHLIWQLHYQEYNVQFSSRKPAAPNTIVIEGVITQFERGSDFVRFLRLLLCMPSVLITPPSVDVLAAHAKADVRICRHGKPRALLVEFQVEIHDSGIGGGQGHLERMLGEAILHFLNKRADRDLPVLTGISCPTYIEK